MDEDCDLADGFDCPNLLCEEEENWDNGGNNHADNNIGGAEGGKKKEKGDKMERKEADEEARGRGLNAGEEEALTADNDEGAVSDKQEDKDANSWKTKDEPMKSGERRGKKQSERLRNKRGQKDVDERPEKKGWVPEGPEMSSEEGLAPSELNERTFDNGHLSDPAYPSSGARQGKPPLHCTKTQLQPSPPQLHGTKRLHSPQPIPHSVEIETTQVYCTRRSVRYSTRGKVTTPDFQLLPQLDVGEPVDPRLLPPAPRKKTRTLYTTEQLEHLEALFLDDHYPDADKRKLIAASVGVTPQRIMVWFQNRRAKWRKMERSAKGKVDNCSNRMTCSSPSKLPTNPSSPTLAPMTSKGTGTLLGNFAPIAPLPPATPSLSAQTLPSYSALLISPSQSSASDGGQHQLYSQHGSAEYHPPPMCSPPPLRRATLPLFATTYSLPKSTLPLLNTTAHTLPLLLETLDSSSSMTYRDPPGRDQPCLQNEGSALFDYGERMDYLISGQQTNSLTYHLQGSYPTNQTQASLPHLAGLNPSPYLTPNLPDSNHTSYLTFGPGGGSNGVVTYAAGNHAYFQTKSNGHLLLQTTGHHGGVTAYQSYPWGNMYSEPAILQHANCPPAHSCSLGATRDHLPSSTPTLTLPSYLTRGSHDPSHTSMQCTSHIQTQNTTSTATVLPPVSTLQPSHLQVESSPPKISPLSPNHSHSPAAAESLFAPSCVKIEYDSPEELHSHFYCDFSSINF